MFSAKVQASAAAFGLAALLLSGCNSRQDAALDQARQQAAATGQAQRVVSVDRNGNTTTTTVQPPAPGQTGQTTTTTVTPGVHTAVSPVAPANGVGYGASAGVPVSSAGVPVATAPPQSAYVSQRPIPVAHRSFARQMSAFPPAPASPSESTSTSA